MTGDAQLAAEVAQDYRQASLAGAERHLLDYAVKLTREPSSMARADVERLKTEGFSDAAILEATHIIGFFNHINRVADALGLEPESEWTR